MANLVSSAGGSALFLVLISSLFACTKSDEKSPPDAGPETRYAVITDDELGLELKLSERWTPSMDTSIPDSVIVDARFVAPISGLAVRPRVVVTKVSLEDAGGMPLAELLNATIDATKSSLRRAGVRLKRVSTKSWTIDEVDVASFELTYVVTHPSSEKENEVNQRTLVTNIEAAGKSFKLDITATFVKSGNQTVGDEIENVFKSVKFSQVKAQ